MFSGVMAMNRLLVLALEVANGTPKIFYLGQILFNPLLIMLHSQVVTSLARFVLRLWFISANFTRPSTAVRLGIARLGRLLIRRRWR